MTISRLFIALYYTCFAWLALIGFTCLIVWITSGIEATGMLAASLIETWYTVAALVFVLSRFVGSLFVRQKS